MRIEEHLAVLRVEGERLADDAERAGLDAEVPTCPGWRVRDLLMHLTGVHRWAASFVATGRTTAYDAAEEAAFFRTVDDADLVRWYRAGHRELVGTLAAAGEDTRCWSFLPAPSPLAFWARRQAHETAIHRADAEAALGTVPRWDPAFAVDGIDELLRGFFARPRGRLVADPPRTLAVVPTDADAAWTMHIEPGGRHVEDGEHAADATVRGPASDLYLLLWNRCDTQRVQVSGERAVLELWRSRARVI